MLDRDTIMLDLKQKKKKKNKKKKNKKKKNINE